MSRRNDFKTMDFLSKTFWHFIRDRRNERDEIIDPALQILLRHVLNDNCTGQLAKDPSGTRFHERTVVVEKAGAVTSAGAALVDDYPGDEEFSIKEPKAVCFADIPFNFLPIHIEAYNGIGLGFYREELLWYESLRPVSYYPRVTGGTLKDACETFAAGENPRQLLPYSKITSKEEPFENIYREREWRIPDNIKFNHNQLSCIVFRTNAELLTAIGNEKVKNLMQNGVSMISCERHFAKASR